MLVQTCQDMTRCPLAHGEVGICRSESDAVEVVVVSILQTSRMLNCSVWQGHACLGNLIRVRSDRNIHMMTRIPILFRFSVRLTCRWILTWVRALYNESSQWLLGGMPGLCSCSVLHVQSARTVLIEHHGSCADVAQHRIGLILNAVGAVT